MHRYFTFQGNIEQHYNYNFEPNIVCPMLYSKHTVNSYNETFSSNIQAKELNVKKNKNEDIKGTKNPHSYLNLSNCKIPTRKKSLPRRKYQKSKTRAVSKNIFIPTNLHCEYHKL